MKYITRILLCMLLLTSILFCACSTGEYVPTEDAEYELVYEWGALVLKENGKTIDSWKARDIFAISGQAYLVDVVTVQGTKEIRSFFKEMFGSGVSFTLMSEEDRSNIGPYRSVIGLSYEDVAPFTYGESTEGLEAKFILTSVIETQPLIFVDRYGNYYMSDMEDLSGIDFKRYLEENYRAISIEHKGE